MTEKQNLENIIETTSKSLKEALDPTVEEIKSIVKSASDTLEAFDALHSQYEEYNFAVDRISNLQRISINARKRMDKKEKIDFALGSRAFPMYISPDSEEGQKILQAINEQTEDPEIERAKVYQEERLGNDIQLINRFRERLTDLSKKGYKEIMTLRQRLTKQEIIYAVQGFGGKEAPEKIYYEFLEEEEFINLLVSKPQKDDVHRLMKINKIRSFSESFLDVDFNILTKNNFEGLYWDRTQDPLYQKVFEEGQKYPKFRPSDAWEMYVEAKSFYGKKDSKFNLSLFIENWQKQKQSHYFAYRRGRTGLDKLAFYQGGDSITYRPNVVVQEKSSSARNNASVKIPTIYNALRDINKVFGGLANGETLNVDDIIKMFTAVLDKNSSYTLGTFDAANTFAQKNILSIVEKLNKKIREKGS